MMQKNQFALPWVPLETRLAASLSLRVGLASRSSLPLSWLPIERINLGAADVARHQQRIIRSQSAPLRVRSKQPVNVFQADQSLQPVIGNPHPEERRIFRKAGIEIQVLPVMRPTRISA